jgi:hypothetical protein
MQTPWWMMTRRVTAASRDRRVAPLIRRRQAGRAWLLAGLMLGLVLLLSSCGADGGSESATRPTTERSGTRPAPSVTESPSVTATAPTRPPRTTAAAPTTARTPTSVAPPTSRPSTAAPTSARTPTPTEPPTSPMTSPATSAAALAPTSTSTPSATGTPAAAESQGLGALGWTLLVVLVVGLIAGWLIWRSRRRSAWDVEAGALEEDTRTTTSIQLPSVLTAEDAGQRALSWPPLRAALVDLVRRWDLLVERAPDDGRRDRAVQVRGLLQELVAAVDAENQALATGRDWRLLRPRVDQAERALSAVLAGVPQQVPAGGGEPGRPASGG